MACGKVPFVISAQPTPSGNLVLQGLRMCLLQMNLVTVAVLHTAMALEDPFDNQGLDGIYVDEALFEAEQVVHLISLPCGPSLDCHAFLFLMLHAERDTCNFTFMIADQGCKHGVECLW